VTRRCLESFLLWTTSCATSPAQTRPFSIEDLVVMERVSDPQVSPDRRSVAFVVRATDLDKNRGRTDLYLAATDGSGCRKLTTHPDNDWQPRWLSDSRSLLFLSARSGSSQVWRIAVAGSEATQVSSFPLDVGAFVVFPDDRRVALTLEVYPDAKNLEETARRAAETDSTGSQARIYDSLLFRHWDTWEDRRRSHLFAWSIGAEKEPVDLMAGWDADCPTRPFGGPEEIAVTRDGTSVIFAAKVVGREAAWSTDVNLWQVPSDASRPPACLTEANPAIDNLPVVSPDGRWLSYVAMERAGYESDRQRVVLRDLRTDESRVLTQGWDRSASELTWSGDSQALYVTADHLGGKGLFALDIGTGQILTLVPTASNSSPQDCGDCVVFAQDSLRSPAELFSVDKQSLKVQQITSITSARMSGLQMARYEQFRFPGAGGEAVYGFMVWPVGFQETLRYPVAFLIHGGPQGSFGDHFHYRWNPQVYAGAGYGVVFVDFHGSTGYGQAFTDSIRGDWGGKPFEDLMKGLDYVLSRYPLLHQDRVAALGASYGGYMINWIAGQTDRFRCLVNHDGNLDERMAYFDTEELWFPEWEHGGVPWDPGSHYQRHNPIDFLGRWKTPMLVIHGALDFRVVDTQGLSTFTALQRRGIPSRLLYFPDENHWVLKPSNSVLWHHTVLDWLKQWTGDGG